MLRTAEGDIIEESRFIINKLLNILKEVHIEQDIWDRTQGLLGQMDNWAANNCSTSTYRDWHHAAADEIDDS